MTQQDGENPHVTGSPSNPTKRETVGPYAAPDSLSVMLCDWRGRITWGSRFGPETEIGDFVWANLIAESQQACQLLYSRVVALRETGMIDVSTMQGVRLRCRLWPLDSPAAAVCLLSTTIPAELGQLTKREEECLKLLARGSEVRDIAQQLDVSQSTVHTHLKRSREKLGLPNVVSLISYAARYCYAPLDSLAGE
jgi:DNA-binding CsgD family transcriptional regulator